ncbi:MAG: ATP-binding cassette domain-containing protein [Planctomycetaceae bacterium]|nr:ATP-binding cassette domain-containing protein [Planctomycetaceae bacterium]
MDIVKKHPHFTLEIHFRAENERLGLLGASGCGKSMTLKCIAGILTPDSGRIVINGKTVFDSRQKINVPPRLRHTGYLFQHYAIFPTMTVRENMAIVLRRLPKLEQKRQIDEMLEKMRLQDVGERKPAQLSGGQQQRAAMGRMLVSSPEIILLDEPLSALDSFLSLAVEAELTEMLANFGGTILFVSHNRDEIYRICQRIVVLDRGKIAAFGTTEELFRNPGTLAAARLTGVKNIAPAFAAGIRKIHVPAWGITLETECEAPSEMTHAAIRAHHIREALDNETTNCFDFYVQRKQSEPFKIQEYLTTVSPMIAPENYSVCVKPYERLPLIRLISGAHDPIFTPEKTGLWKRLCLPPKYVMLLQERFVAR